MDYSKAIGFQIPVIPFNLTCYTNPKTFHWFHENPSDYLLMQRHIHAAMIFMTKNFLSTIVMKAWVTCALDVNCISPEGHRLAPCCGCHRYDQSALQVILSHFYWYPVNYKEYSPAYGHYFQSHDLYYFLGTRPQ